MQRHNELAEHGWIVVTNGLLALAYAYQGKLSQTLIPLAQVTAASITSFAIFEGYASAAEVKLMLWEQGDTSQNWSDSLKESMAVLKKYIRVFAVGKPRYYLYQGLAYWLSNDHAKAQEAWQRSLAEAEALAMPFEQALAHYEIGRHLPKTDPARKTHLEKAGALSQQLKAAYLFERVQTAIEA